MRQVFHVPLLLKVSCLLDSEAVFVKSFAKPPLYVFKPVREPNISPFGLALIKYLVQKGKETFKVSKLNTKSQPTTKSTLWLIISITLSKVSHLDPPRTMRWIVVYLHSYFLRFLFGSTKQHWVHLLG